MLEAGSFPGGANLANFATGSLATSFSAGGVPPGVYYARVRARNDAGTSAASNEVSFTIGATPCTPPGTPGSLSASISGFSVTLTWNAPPSGGVPTTYLIEAGSSSGGTDLATFATGSTATSFTGTAGPGTFFVRVRARNACGTSGPSNEVLVTTPAPPGGRTTIDRPDEVSGYQGKVMYVLPSDGVDQALDTDGTLRTSVAAFQRWLERESGQRVRMDTFGGALDTTFVRLGRSDAVRKSSFMTLTVPGATPPPGWPGGPALTLPFERAPGDPLRFLCRLLPTGPAR